MPTYTYECPACGHAFDEFQSMSDRPLKTCPACKKRRLRRLIGSGAGIVFKGSGFYITDYKKGGKGGPSRDGKAEGAPKSESKSESKKPESKSSDTKPTTPKNADT